MGADERYLRRDEIGVGADMTAENPLVSIAIATYNRAHLIGLTLDSLRAQTVSNFEIIVSDDASTDDTERVCGEYARRDSRVRYDRNATRLGLANNCSRVLRLTRGEFVVLAGDDDVYDPAYLERLISLIRSDDRIAIAACRVDVIDQSGTFVRHVGQSYPTRPCSSRLESASTMLWKGFGNLMTGVYRRQHLMRTLLYRSAYRDYWDAVDLLFLFEMAIYGQIVWLDEVLLHKRAGGISARPIERSFAATIVTVVAVWRAYIERVRRSDLKTAEKFFLIGSVCARMIGNLWTGRFAFAYSLLANVDKRGSLRRRLREVLPDRVLKGF